MAMADKDAWPAAARDGGRARHGVEAGRAAPCGTEAGSATQGVGVRSRKAGRRTATRSGLDRWLGEGEEIFFC